MENVDLLALFGLCQEARERFPDAWEVFLAEFDEPVEARREAFAALLGYINSHLSRKGPGIPRQTLDQRQRFICLGLLSFLPKEEMYEELAWRFWRDLVPVDESLAARVELPLSGSILADLMLPPARPTATARWMEADRIEIDFDRQGHPAMEILINDRGCEWRFLARTTQDCHWDSCDPECSGYDEDDPPDPPVLFPLEWRYRIRVNDQRDPMDSDCIPIGMWSEEIPVVMSA